jgi:hypothetical protein
MSFVFPSWETAFSPAFHEDAKAMLEGALNKVSERVELTEGHAMRCDIVGSLGRWVVASLRRCVVASLRRR